MKNHSTIKIPLAGGEVSCLRFGKGKNLLIALHGFAQTGANFEAITQIWGNDFIIYAPDLPFHGDTRWHETNFSSKDVQELITAILQKENSTSYRLLGFSLGGRIILSTVKQLSPLPSSVTLIAPDGIATKRMFLPRIIPNFIKKSILKNNNLASFVVRLTRVLHKLKWVDTFSLRYVNYHFQSNERRERLLNTWLLLSSFQVKSQNIKPFLVKKELPVSIFLSKKDQYIASEAIQHFAKDISSIDIYEYNGKHRLDDKELLNTLSTYSHLNPHRNR